MQTCPFKHLNMKFYRINDFITDKHDPLIGVLWFYDSNFLKCEIIIESLGHEPI